MGIKEVSLSCPHELIPRNSHQAKQLFDDEKELIDGIEKSDVFEKFDCQPFYNLLGRIQDYIWGGIGFNSLVGRVAHENFKHFDTISHGNEVRTLCNTIDSKDDYDVKIENGSFDSLMRNFSITNLKEARNRRFYFLDATQSSHWKLSQSKGFVSKLCESKAYAEMWLGCHKNAETFIIIPHYHLVDNFKNTHSFVENNYTSNLNRSNCNLTTINYECIELGKFLSIYLNNVPSSNYSICSKIINSKSYNHTNDGNGLLNLNQFEINVQNNFRISNSLETPRNHVTTSFLLKILSVNNPLSIQSHPNNSDILKLCSNGKEDFLVDKNSKPEMAVSLVNNFYLLCGFKMLNEILFFIDKISELRQIFFPMNYDEDKTISDVIYEGCTRNTCSKNSEIIKDLVDCLLNTEKNKLSQVVDQIIHNKRYYDVNLENLFSLLSIKYDNQSRTVSDETNFFLGSLKQIIASNNSVGATKSNDEEKIKEITYIFRYLHLKYPYDIGIFFCFFLNFFSLRKYEAIFLPPRTLHSYIYGHCIECMGNSDNVFRFGLTHKQVHKEFIFDMVNFNDNDLLEFSVTRKYFCQPEGFQCTDQVKKCEFSVIQSMKNFTMDYFRLFMLSIPFQRQSSFCFTGNKSVIAISIVIESGGPESFIFSLKGANSNNNYIGERLHIGSSMLLFPGIDYHFYNKNDVLNNSKDNIIKEEELQNLIIFVAIGQMNST